MARLERLEAERVARSKPPTAKGDAVEPAAGPSRAVPPSPASAGSPAPTGSQGTSVLKLVGEGRYEVENEGDKQPAGELMADVDDEGESQDDSEGDDDVDTSDDEDGEDDESTEGEPAAALPPGTAGDDASLPFTFQMPQTAAEFEALLEPHDAAAQGTVLVRVAACHHVTLRAENRALMAGLWDMALPHSLAHGPGLLSAMAPGLYAIAQQLPEHAATTTVAALEAVAPKLKGSRPALEGLLLLRLVPVLFPASDFRHPVVTPALTLLGAALARCRPDGAHGVGAALLLVAIAHEYAKHGAKLVPEAMVLLRGLLLCGAGGGVDVAAPPPLAAVLAAGGGALSPDEGQVAEAGGEAAYRAAPDLGVAFHSRDPAGWRAATLRQALRLSRGFAVQHSALAARGALLEPGAAAAEALAANDPTLADEATAAAEAIRAVATCGRIRLLALQKHKPVPLPEIEPKFRQTYTARKGEGLEPDERELQKLQRLQKQEMRGAVRELRRDAKYIAGKRQGEKRQFDEERDRVVKQVESELQREVGKQRAQERIAKIKRGRMG